MVSEKLIVRNHDGIHLEPAKFIAKTAETCTSLVEIRYRTHIINAKSMLNIVSASIPCGAEIELTCEGKNEEEDMRHMLYMVHHLRNLKADEQTQDTKNTKETKETEEDKTALS